MSLEYPSRDTISIPSTGDPDVDETILDDYILRVKRLIEGICANGCAPLVTDDPHTQHCPQCNFIYRHRPQGKE